jgi:hypothetical protein
MPPAMRPEPIYGVKVENNNILIKKQKVTSYRNVMCIYNVNYAFMNWPHKII